MCNFPRKIFNGPQLKPKLTELSKKCWPENSFALATLTTTSNNHYPVVNI